MCFTCPHLHPQGNNVSGYIIGGSMGNDVWDTETRTESEGYYREILRDRYSAAKRALAVTEDEGARAALSDLMVTLATMEAVLDEAYGWRALGLGVSMQRVVNIVEDGVSIMGGA